jgi:hypothetical protein
MKNFWLLFICLLTAPLTTMAHTYLQIICEPGVDIYLNDQFLAKSNWADGGLHIKISPGNYHLEAKKAGFKSQKMEVSLKKSDVKLWELAPFAPLKGAARAAADKLALQSQAGSLTIYSKPNGCVITLVSASGSKASWPKKQKRWQAQKIPTGKYTVKAQALGKTLSYDLEIHPADAAVLYFDFQAGAASLRNVLNIQ